jgi:hypothetical protein
MKIGKIWFLLLGLVLLVAVFGCSSDSSSNGSASSSTPPPQTDTQKLVGTWNFVKSTDGINTGTLVFKSDGTGTWGGSGFSNGKVTNGVFTFNLSNGQAEAFDCNFSNNNNTVALTNHNGGNTYTYNRAG